MISIQYENVNPKNRKTGDCSIRALAKVLNISWDEALTLLYKKALETKYEPADRRTMEKVLEAYGYVKMKQPRKEDNTKYTVAEMDKVLKSGDRCVVNVAHHFTTIINYVCYDTWDCRRKSVGNYYLKIK